jgi:hypothetical protein
MSLNYQHRQIFAKICGNLMDDVNIFKEFEKDYVRLAFDRVSNVRLVASRQLIKY